MKEAVLRVTVTRGGGPRGYAPPATCVPRTIISVAGAERNWKQLSRPVHLGVARIRLAAQPQLAGIKHLNRLENVLASNELEGLDVAEGILIDGENHVIGGISSNIFMVFKGQLLTPRLDRSGVRGVLRARILKAFKARCELRRVSPEMLAEASEVFICNAVRGIVPINRIDEISYPLGPVTRELQQWWQESQVQK